MNENFEKQAFKELWKRINRKAIYRVEFESSELVDKCIGALNKELQVTLLEYWLERGTQKERLTDDQLKVGAGFSKDENRTEQGGVVNSLVKYDLIGKLAENVQLKRQTVAEILCGIERGVFEKFKQNPDSLSRKHHALLTNRKPRYY